jgi:hypothetical protein
MWKKSKKTIMSHYDFRQQIALAWLLSASGNSNQGKKRSRTISAHKSQSTLSSNKARKVSDASLDPNNGALRIRLDDDQHFPVNPTTKRPCCSLCRWVEKERMEKIVLVLFFVISVKYPYVLIASNLSTLYLVCLNYDRRLLRINFKKRRISCCEAANKDIATMG